MGTRLLQAIWHRSRGLRNAEANAEGQRAPILGHHRQQRPNPQWARGTQNRIAQAGRVALIAVRQSGCARAPAQTAAWSCESTAGSLTIRIRWEPLNEDGPCCSTVSTKARRSRRVASVPRPRAGAAAQINALVSGSMIAATRLVELWAARTYSIFALISAGGRFSSGMKNRPASRARRPSEPRLVYTESGIETMSAPATGISHHRTEGLSQ